MRSLKMSFRLWVVAMVVTVAAALLPVRAEEGVKPDPAAAWQQVISGQIQAFRDRDASTAFDYAGTAYKVSFNNADIFFEAIVNSGYAPIMESQSHSFGGYRVIGDIGVVQQVLFIGNDQQLYEAVYQLLEEGVGWRVQGVQLFRSGGMAV